MIFSVKLDGALCDITGIFVIILGHNAPAIQASSVDQTHVERKDEISTESDRKNDNISRVENAETEIRNLVDEGEFLFELPHFMCFNRKFFN